MKKTFLLLLICATISYAQEKDSNFKIHSTSIGFGGFYVKKNNSEIGGASFVADLVFDYKNNLISVRHLTGTEIGVVGKSTYNFNETSILYGREISLKKWLLVQGFTGFGYYNQTSKTNYFANGNTLSIPINIKIVFNVSKHFTIGSSNNYSITNINNNFSSNLAFGYTF